MSELTDKINPIATVINNNLRHWLNMVETKPTVTLDVGLELFTRAQLELACMSQEQRIEALEGKLNDAITRMDRARNILTKGEPTQHCNWGVLDTTSLKENPWISVADGLPEIPEGQHAVTVLVAYIDVYEQEDFPERGYYTSDASFGKDGKFKQLTYPGGVWMELDFTITDWQYMPEHPRMPIPK